MCSKVGNNILFNAEINKRLFFTIILSGFRTFPVILQSDYFLLNFLKSDYETKNHYYLFVYWQFAFAAFSQKRIIPGAERMDQYLPF